MLLCLLLGASYVAWQVFAGVSSPGGSGRPAWGASSRHIDVHPPVKQHSHDVTGGTLFTISGDTTGAPGSATEPQSTEPQSTEPASYFAIPGLSGSPAPSPESAPTSAQSSATPTPTQPGLPPPSTPASPTPAPAPALSDGAPALPAGVTGTFVGMETGAQLFADPAWQKSSGGQIQPASSCSLWGTSAMYADGTYLDMYVPKSPAWECAAIESQAAVAPGHIYQIEEYIPALVNGNIADYPSWWMTDTGWNSEVDMAEAHAWGDTATVNGSMCLDVHLSQGAHNTTPNCLTEAAGWHTYTMVWAATGAVTMFYDGTEVRPIGISGTGATDMHMIIWNNNNGGSGSVDSTLKLAYLAEWST